MQSISNAVNRLVDSWGPEAAAALRRARNKDRFRAAVQRTWRTRPEVATLVLRSTCSIYIAPDTRPRKGPDKDRERWIFGLYVNDAMVRTEVDAWQSVLLQALRFEGMTVDEIRILPATRDMRQRRLFPELEGEEGAVAPVPAVGERTERDKARALDVVKCAAVLAFGDTERAWAFLEKVQAAALDEAQWSRPVDGPDDEAPRLSERQYWLTLYVEDVPAMQKLVDAFGDAIRSHARRLGLRLRAIAVRPGSREHNGARAFSREASSRALDEGRF